MTNLIYRGARHDGQRNIEPRKARAMIYRGAVHDGLPEAAPSRPARTEMCYRGIRYSAGADGAVAGLIRTLAPTGQAAAEPQTA